MGVIISDRKILSRVSVRPAIELNGEGGIRTGIIIASKQCIINTRLPVKKYKNVTFALGMILAQGHLNFTLHKY